MYSIIKHFANPNFWMRYHSLPLYVQKIADKKFVLLKSTSKHPSLHLKKIEDLWTVRVGTHYRAIGIDAPSGDNAILWFWIGSHSEYDHLIKQK
jgi:hypothetical protein